MPNILDLFGKIPDVTVGGENDGFDVTAFFDAADAAIGANTARHEAEMTTESEAAGVPILQRAAAMGKESASEPIMPTGEVTPEAEPAPDPEPFVPTLDPEPVVQRETSADPLASLPDDHRARLLALDQLLSSNPETAERVFRAAIQPEPTPVVVAPAEPTLPPEFDPDSTEARLWMDNRALERKIEELTGAVHQQSLTFEEQRAQTEAANAIRSFAMRYNGQLDQSDIMQISQEASKSGLAGALTQSQAYKGNPQAAYEKALEDTLWTNDSFRQKIIGVTTPVQPGETEEARQRKAALGALSSAASPIAGPAPRREPLAVRDDGRLTPESRRLAVQELATGLARAWNQG